MVRFKRQLIISFAIIFISVAAATVALYFLSGAIVLQANKIQTDRALINNDTNVLGVVSGLKEQMPQANNYQAAIDQILPTQDGLIGFSDWFSMFAKNYGVTTNVTLTGSPTSPASSTPGISDFSLQANGSFSNLVAFIDGLETKSQGFLVQISSFAIASDGADDKLTAQGTVFFRP
jgi:hypothetical protein